MISNIQVCLFLGYILLYVSSTGIHTSSISRNDIIRTIKTKHPSYSSIDPAFECAWRGLAFEYAQVLQPFRSNTSFSTIFDALELGVLCNQTYELSKKSISLPSTTQTLNVKVQAATTLYVDYVNGNDNNAGTQNAPLQHLAYAIVHARGLPQPTSIILRDGVHRLTNTITLDSQDNGLSISAFPGETPVVSSGLALKTNWVQANPVNTPTTHNDSGCVWTTFANVDAMYGDWPSPYVQNLSYTASAADCSAKCQSMGSNCYSWIWYDPAGNNGPEWSSLCFARSDGVWAPVAQDYAYSGYCVTPPPLPNIWKADLNAGGTPIPASLTEGNSAVITMLYSPDGGKTPFRAIRARWPNADPELDLFPKGWASGGKRTAPPCNSSDSQVTHVPLPNNYGPGEFSDYYFGQGGTCDRFEDGEWIPPSSTAISYWCQPNGRVAGCTYFVGSPTQIALTSTELPNAPYKSDIVKGGAVVQYWRNGHWFSMMVRVDSASYGADNSTTLGWSYGAFQGAEGDSTGEDFFIEHVFEELDYPREFFFDASTQTLYFNHNATPGTPPPATWTFEVPSLPCLINISGTNTVPAQDISISGITFTSASASFLMAHGIPSGGDWGLSRMGAIFANGASGLTIADNNFVRLDGNAIFLSGWNRNTSILRNEFSWIGESAVASWGYTQGVDATAGLQPWYTTMDSNICREIGSAEKQVSCYFAATSAFATITNNIFFNMPRAAVNFNDDMGGGSHLVRNLVWNTCRESQDHGPFNRYVIINYFSK
jgi:hypothetical protein